MTLYCGKCLNIFNLVPNLPTKDLRMSVTVSLCEKRHINDKNYRAGTIFVAVMLENLKAQKSIMIYFYYSIYLQRYV